MTRIKLNNILSKVLNEGVEISKSDKKTIKDSVIGILHNEKLDFNEDYVTVSAPKKIDSLHIDLPVMPSDRAKQKIIDLAKRYNLVPDGHDSISKTTKHVVLSMSFKKV